MFSSVIIDLKNAFSIVLSENKSSSAVDNLSNVFEVDG